HVVLKLPVPFGVVCHPPERSQQSETAESHKADGGEERLVPVATPSPPSEPPAEPSSHQLPLNSLVGPEAVVPCGTFQGTAVAGDMQRPLLNMDFPQWDKDHSLRTTLEDMELPCQRPDTVKKERYHIYRVYSAGDAQNVRLCRIQNLAQHLHTKDLALFLFV
ncbi:hypothetical protein CCH79_00003388, partial [Gambusia affinis]